MKREPNLFDRAFAREQARRRRGLLPHDLHRALAWVRDGYAHKLDIIGVDERALFRAGLVTSHGELTSKGRDILERPERHTKTRGSR